MKIDELIEELEQVKEEHGNIHVVTLFDDVLLHVRTRRNQENDVVIY